MLSVEQLDVHQSLKNVSIANVRCAVVQTIIMTVPIWKDGWDISSRKFALSLTKVNLYRKSSSLKCAGYFCHNLWLRDMTEIPPLELFIPFNLKIIHKNPRDLHWKNMEPDNFFCWRVLIVVQYFRIMTVIRSLNNSLNRRKHVTKVVGSLWCSG